MIHLIASGSVGARCGSESAQVLAYDLPVVTCAACVVAFQMEDVFVRGAATNYASSMTTGMFDRWLAAHDARVRAEAV